MVRGLDLIEDKNQKGAASGPRLFKFLQMRRMNLPR